MIVTRLIRSATAAMGTAPSTSATPPKLRTPCRVVSLMSKVSWMSGANTRTARGRSSMTFNRNIITTMNEPPASTA